MISSKATPIANLRKEIMKEENIIPEDLIMIPPKLKRNVSSST